MSKQKFISACLFVFLPGFFVFEPVRAAPRAAGSTAANLFEKYYRTELYFGMDRGGESVGEESWESFLNDEVTPRFPKGLTVLGCYGQFQGAGERIVREKCKMLILLYPKSARREAHLKIEELRALYRKRFGQESVLRLDYSKSVDVTF